MKTKKKIAILGLSHHPLAFDNLCYLFQDYDVTIYSDLDYYKNLSKYGAKFYRGIPKVVSKIGQQLNSFLDEIKPELEKVDMVVIPTLRREFSWFEKNWLNTRTVLFIHCLNYWSFPNKHLSLSDITPISKIKYLLSFYKRQETSKRRLRILENMSAINFHDPGIKNYYSRTKQGKNRLLGSMPYAFYIPEYCDDKPSCVKKISLNKTIDFVVPGTISPNRRDYFWLLNSFAQAASKTNVVLRVSLLGRLNQNIKYGKEIKYLATKLESEIPNLKIRYFDTNKFISRKKFDSVMNKANVIMSSVPLSRIKIFKEYREIYGKTTSSHWADVVRFAKPGIFPTKSFQVELLKEIVSFYANRKELVEQILHFTKNDYLVKKTNQAQKISREEFSYKAVCKRFFLELGLNDFT